MKQYSLARALIMMLIGGLMYLVLELLWRGHTHISMLVLGGVCFGILGEIDRNYTAPLILQMALGAVSVTGLEFLFGVILNIWMGLGVWNYSNTPFNLMGQVCLLYSAFWFFLSGVCVIVYRILYRVFFHI